MVDRITPHENKQFIDMTACQALLDALSHVDDYDMVFVVMVKKTEDNEYDLYNTGAAAICCRRLA